MQIYIEIAFSIVPFKEELADIIIAELADLQFDNFITSENNLKAYIKKDFFDRAAIDQIYFLKSNPAISYSIKEIVEENWNKNWESSYNFIELENCIVVAPFHKNYPRKEFELFIAPKMSFGTGHHSTTYMMLDFMLEMNLKNKHVLDMGCGTGVLAILAAKKNAKNITAIDIDEWAVENTKENISLNNVQHIKVMKGNKELLLNKHFDVIFANINRNILVEHMPVYANALSENGKLILSGFYTTDSEILQQEGTKNKLQLIKKKERTNWCALSFTKV